MFMLDAEIGVALGVAVPKPRGQPLFSPTLITARQCVVKYEPAAISDCIVMLLNYLCGNRRSQQR